MNKRDWLKKLQMELYRMPRNEIDDAVAYYSEYFEEAGPEREQEIISELGDPAKVAAQIKADYAVRQLDDMEREEARGERGRFWNRFGRRDSADSGYRRESWQEHVGNGPDFGQQDGWQNTQGGADYNNYNRQGAYNGPQGGYQNRQDGYRAGYNSGYDDAKKGRYSDPSNNSDEGYRDGYNNGYSDGRARGGKGRVGLVIAAIIGGILAAPIALPVAFVLIGLAIAGIVVVGAIIIGLIALAAGGVVAGIAVLISAFLTAGATAASMLVIIGTGLAIAGGSLLLGFLVIKGAAALIRAIARGISNRRARKQMAGGYNPGANQNNSDYQYSYADGETQTADGFTEAGADGFTDAAAESTETAPDESAEEAAEPEPLTAEAAEEPAADSEEGFVESAAADEWTQAPLGDSSNTNGEVNEDAGK